MTAMRRLRLLAGLLGCLAVLAASLPAVALGSLSSVAAQKAVSEPCDHCPDCQGGPCQPAMAGCMQSCVASAPALCGASFLLQALSTTETVSLRSQAALHGLSPPPDPFPPRF